MLLTRSPLIHTNQKGKRFTVRLACVKHAASVRPEPGSNSPNKTNKQAPTNPTQQSTRKARATVSTTVQKTRPGPTQPQTHGARQTKTKQAPKNHTQPCAAPRDHGIKNMTHYRVLKQHTHPDLDQVSRLHLCSGEQLGYSRTFAGSTSTLRALLSVTPTDVPLQRTCHRRPAVRLSPLGSGLYFRQAHPTHVKPGFHDPGHTSFSSSFQHFRRAPGCTAVDPRRPSVSTERPGRLVSTSQFTVQLSGVRSRTPATIKEHMPCLLPPVAPALVPDPMS